MKFKNLFTLVRNSRNNQQAFVLKARAFKQRKLTPEQILEMQVPKKTKPSFGVKR